MADEDQYTSEAMDFIFDVHVPADSTNMNHYIISEKEEGWPESRGPRP